MFVLLSAIVALHLTAAHGFLDDCPTIDMTHRLGGELVVDVLKTFYDDLVFVGTATETCQRRDYRQVIAEMTGSTEPDPFLKNIARLLSEDRFEDAVIMLSGNPNQWYAGDPRKRTFLSYFQAETNRLLNLDGKAFEYVQRAVADRKLSEGVSVNVLERLNSLIALKGVSRFNRDVDRVHGLIESPNYEQLPLLHSYFKNHLNPFAVIRSTIADKFSGIISAQPGDVKRADPDLDEFDGQSVAKTSVDGMLCEFARKLNILGVSHRNARPLSQDHNYVLGQIEELDYAFGFDLRTIVNIFGSNATRARDALYHIWRSAPLKESKEVFVRYFDIEFDRQSKGSCYLLYKMQQGIKTIRNLREDCEGLGLGSLLDLEAKVLFRWMNCVHQRLRLFYRLEGNEDEQQLEAKRAQFGGGDRKLPEVELPGFNP